MINYQTLIYVGGLVVITSVGRIWAKAKVSAREKKKHTTPLYDAVLLEIATTPVKGEDDDPDVLAEVRATLAHLNRQSFADEFWGLDKQLVPYYGRLPVKSRPTMRRALVRLLESGDHWLEVVAARTCANLTLREAVPVLTARLDAIAAEPGASTAQQRFHDELSKALDKLSAQPSSAE